METESLKFTRIMSSLILLTGFTSAALFTGVAFGQADRYTLHLYNSSGYDIREIYVSSSGERGWNRDLLGADALSSPGSFDVTNISAGEWDIKLVGKDGDTCVRRYIPFFHDRTVDITRGWLIGCERYTAANSGAE